MSNSSLVDLVGLSNYHGGLKKYRISRITPHCIVGQLTCKSIIGYFGNPATKASCNYAIGSDTLVGLIVDEANYSYCSSSESNDQRAVTIECASEKNHPYSFRPEVYNKLVELCVDICKRNGATKLLWLGSREATLSYSPANNEIVLTAHRWFKNKACPGEWLYSRYGELAKEVTARLSGGSDPVSEYQVVVNASDLKIRKGPGTNCDAVGYTGKGTFTIVEEADGPGASKWGKLKSGAGWISLDYATKAADGSYSVKVSIPDLKIRKGPGTNYPSNGFTGIGSFTIVEEAPGVGANRWGRLKSGAGWIALDYTKRV